MPRRREVPKRPIIPDPKYRDKLVSKFINAEIKFEVCVVEAEAEMFAQGKVDSE